MKRRGVPLIGTNRRKVSGDYPYPYPYLYPYPYTYTYTYPYPYETRLYTQFQW